MFIDGGNYLYAFEKNRDIHVTKYLLKITYINDRTFFSLTVIKNVILCHLGAMNGILILFSMQSAP